MIVSMALGLHSTWKNTQQCELDREEDALQVLANWSQHHSQISSTTPVGRGSFEDQNASVDMSTSMCSFIYTKMDYIVLIH